MNKGREDNFQNLGGVIFLSLDYDFLYNCLSEFYSTICIKINTTYRPYYMIYNIRNFTMTAFNNVVLSPNCILKFMQKITKQILNKKIFEMFGLPKIDKQKSYNKNPHEWFRLNLGP